MQQPTFILEQETADQLRPELAALLGPNNTITKAFCELFLSLEPPDEQVAQHSHYPKGCTGDGDQDLRETFQLTGQWEEQEGLCSTIYDAIEHFNL